MKTLNQLSYILVAVSVSTLLFVGFFKLDFLWATLIGNAIVGLNFFATRRIMRNAFQQNLVNKRMLVFYCLKLGISMVVLYLTIVQWAFPPEGVLLGVSTIVIAVMIQTVWNMLFAPVEQAADPS